MSSPDQTKRPRRRLKASTSDEGKWLPWGLYDDKEVQELSQETVREAATRLGLAEEAGISKLRDELRKIAIAYSREKRDVIKPGPKWFRQQVTPVKEATEKLYQLIHGHPGGIGLNSLARLTEIRMGRPIRGRVAWAPLDQQRESIEELLERFAKVCAECLRRRGSPGAKEQKHLHHATKMVVELWENLTGKKLGLNLETDIGRSGTEFISRGPQFVHFVLTAVDHDIELAQTATALRKVLGTPRVRNSA